MNKTATKQLRRPLWVWLLTALNAAAVLAIILYALAKTSATMYWVDDGFVVLYCMGVFALIPFGLIAVLVLKRRGPVDSARGPRLYRRGSYVFLILAWLALTPLTLFWGAIYLHVYEPWPLSLSQGPDTDRARQGFQRLLGFAPDAAVNQIHYRAIEIRDSSLFLRFNYSDPEILERIILAQDMVPLGADTRAKTRSNYLGEDKTMASWWVAEEIAAAAQVFVDRDLGEALNQPASARAPIGLMKVLWIDEDRRIAYFAYHTF